MYCSSSVYSTSCVKTGKLTVFPQALYGQYIVEIYDSWLSDDIVRFKIEVGVEEKTLNSRN